MDDRIGRLDASISVDRAASEKAVGIVADYSFGQSSAATARAFMCRSAGADRAINATQTISNSGVVPGALGGAVPAGIRVTVAVTRTPIGNARERARKNAVGAIAGAAPRLSHFV